MDLLTTFAIPSIAFYLMWIVGQSLVVNDFLRIYQYPKQVIFATIGQLLLIPLTAGLIIVIVQPGLSLSIGMILIAACPAGIISNFYCHIAKTNTALSITLTAVGSLLAIITLPLILGAGLYLLRDGHQVIQVPAREIILQLLIMLLLPIALGMWVKHRFPTFVDNFGNLFQRSSIFLVAVLIALIFYNQQDLQVEELTRIMLLSLLFTVVLMGLIWLLSFLLKSSASDRIVLLLEFPVRNLAIAAVISVNIFGHTDYVVFGAVMFVTQLPVVGLVILYSRLNPVAN